MSNPLPLTPCKEATVETSRGEGLLTSYPSKGNRVKCKFCGFNDCQFELEEAFREKFKGSRKGSLIEYDGSLYEAMVVETYRDCRCGNRLNIVFMLSAMDFLSVDAEVYFKGGLEGNFVVHKGAARKKALLEAIEKRKQYFQEKIKDLTLSNPDLLDCL